jgi:hypothetical protein
LCCASDTGLPELDSTVKSNIVAPGMYGSLFGANRLFKRNNPTAIAARVTTTVNQGLPVLTTILLVEILVIVGR